MKNFVSIEELEGFSLDNYQDLKHFTFGQWRDLIFVRQTLWTLTDPKVWRATPSHSGPALQQDYQNLLLLIAMSTQLGVDVPAEGLTKMRALSTDLATARFDGRHKDATGVKQLLEHEMVATIEALRPELCTSVGEFILRTPLQGFDNPMPLIDANRPLFTASLKIIPQDYAGPADPALDAINMALFGGINGIPLHQAFETAAAGDRRVHLAVDIGASDEQLISDFSKWLLQWRMTFKESTKIKEDSRAASAAKKTLIRWVEQRVVPYTDLMLLARLWRRRQFRPADIHEEIFPNEQTATTISVEADIKRMNERRKEFLGDRSLLRMNRLSHNDSESQVPPRAT